MPDQWFRAPNATIDGADAPKHADGAGVTGYSGFKLSSSPIWVVRFYGDTATLDSIASDPVTTQLTTTDAVGLLGGAWTSAKLNASFEVA